MPEDTVDVVKPGIKTTEFWLTILSNLIGVGGLLSGIIPPELGIAIVGIANAVYAFVRAITKSKA